MLKISFGLKVNVTRVGYCLKYIDRVPIAEFLNRFRNNTLISLSFTHTLYLSLPNGPTIQEVFSQFVNLKRELRQPPDGTLLYPDDLFKLT